MFYQPHQRLQEGLLIQQYLHNLGVSICRQSQVQHGDKSLLHPALSLRQYETEKLGSDFLEYHAEESRVQFADMAQGNCGACPHVLSIGVIRVLAGGGLFLALVEEDGEEVVDALEGSESVAGGGALGRDVLEGLAGVETDCLVLTDTQTADDNIDGFVGELPDWVGLLIVELGGCVEQILTQSGDGLLADLFVLVLHGLNQLIAYIAFSQFILYDS